eukprot:12420182-Alexandrium_andersonii.AAC.1
MQVLLSWPILKSKAARILDVSDWLAHKLAGEGTDREALHWGLSTWFLIIRRGNKWLTTDEKQRLQTARDAVFFSYQSLAAQASQQGKARYPYKPKMHVLDHLVRDAIASSCNPGVDWTFQE